MGSDLAFSWSILRTYSPSPFLFAYIYCEFHVFVTVMKTILRETGIAAYGMHEVDKYGIKKVIEMALNRINPGLTRPIHLSFDIDGLDPSAAASTGTICEVCVLFCHVCSQLRCCSVSCSLWSDFCVVVGRADSSRRTVPV